MSLFEPGSERDGDTFSDAALVRAMVEVEQAWLRMRGHDVSLEAPPVERVAEGAERAGNPVVPLVDLLREQVPKSADAFHRGLTSQDVLDTALVLLCRRAGSDIDVLLRRSVEATRAKFHASAQSMYGHTVNGILLGGDGPPKGFPGPTPAP